MRYDDVCISSGHSKFVAGASKYIIEITEARRVVEQVSEYLKSMGCNVDKFHDNSSKTQRDNINTIVRYHDSKKRGLNVSIHFNANKTTDQPVGVEVLYVNDNIKGFAAEVSEAISKASGLKNRGAKKRTNLGFLNQTDAKAILVEVCFVDSSKDVELYKAKFNEICKAIAESITGKTLSTPEPKPIVSTISTPVKQAEKSVQILTGGLTATMIKDIAQYFIDKNWWAEIQFLPDNKNPRALTGGLSGDNRKEFEAWLKNKGWFYEIVS